MVNNNETTDQLEAVIGAGGASSSHGELGSLLRKTAYLRRFLSPQREALDVGTSLLTVPRVESISGTGYYL